MRRLEQIEKAAVGVVRKAGHYGVHLTHLGFEVAAVADWLEQQIPRVRHALRAAAKAAAAQPAITRGRGRAQRQS